jgi:formylglycine-generating enzyme required for sulfatase activity
LTAVGSYTDSASYYGTYDQSGDVYNWESTVVSSDYPVLRGGFWNNVSNSLASSARNDFFPTDPGLNIGFRVASVPEPNSLMLILAAVAGLALIRGKPFKL